MLMPSRFKSKTYMQKWRIKLASGGCVGVIAAEFTAIDDRAEADIENLRTLSRDDMIQNLGIEGFRQYEKPTGAVWGTSGDNGRPVIIDLGDLTARER